MIITDPTSPEFNSYTNVADLKNFASARGNSLPEDDEEIETLLIQAMDYLEGLTWRGKPEEATQPLAWPRTGINLNGSAVVGIPLKVIQAQCRLAIEAQTVDLSPTFSGGGEVTQETVVGAVSVSYAEGSSTSAPYFSWLSGLLRGLTGASSSVNFDVMRG
ncbi:hypothetical protein CWS43_09785 [Rahnella sp. AA]|uniref:DnaT-like ssDNA-binding protein n=1 Tax=Rahnella sp. AA TaxID=2057180 RepID=UPI000C31F08E|nr:DnaT-like ssDNA-binding protein [Rahnella sp. AA]PKE30962.1 hypothetical protein CWS43_09785 [Rahnella sp. AA]